MQKNIHKNFFQVDEVFSSLKMESLIDLRNNGPEDFKKLPHHFNFRL